MLPRIVAPTRAGIGSDGELTDELARRGSSRAERGRRPERPKKHREREANADAVLPSRFARSAGDRNSSAGAQRSASDLHAHAEEVLAVDVLGGGRAARQHPVGEVVLLAGRSVEELRLLFVVGLEEAVGEGAAEQRRAGVQVVPVPGRRERVAQSSAGGDARGLNVGVDLQLARLATGAADDVAAV